MRLTVLATMTLIAGAALAQVQWAPAADYKLNPDGSVEVSDGGGSTGDRYLLSAQDYRDFSFEFDLTAKPAGGSNLRAIVVWDVDPAKTENRKAIFLPAHAFKLDQRTHLRLLVLGERCALYQDGQLISSDPTVYGEPPAQGRVGLLHYYNHNFRYENLKLAPLNPETLLSPQKLQAKVLPGGAVRLTWEIDSDYAPLLRYRVYRLAKANEPLSEENMLGEAAGRELDDITAQSKRQYRYAVVSVAREDLVSQPATISLKTGALPPPQPPMGVSATQRTNGQVRLRWQVAEGSRCGGLAIYRAATPAALEGPQAEAVAALLPAPMREYVVAASPGTWYAVGIKSPDGGKEMRTVVQAQPMAPAFTAGAGVPERHPYLLYGQEQLERVRRALQTKEYEKLLTSLRGTADSYLQTPAAVPAEPTDGQSSVSSRMQQMGLYYQALGDERYAQWVHDALVAYAKLYGPLPVRGGRVKLAKTISGLYEATWFVPLVCAYDLVYESPCFTPDDRKLIENELLRPGADLFWVRNYDDPKDNRPGDLHYKCYNFEAWFISSVGLCGLMLRDADMVEHAIDGPYGLKHLLAHDVQDDGMFWERSAGYHGFVVSALFPFLEAGVHCNLDLYKLAVPDDYNTDREPLSNYCVGDGDNGPKSMKLMFDGPFYYTFPDLTWPVVADSGRGPLSPNAAYRAAWEHYRDPKYAWLINRNRVPTVPKLGVKDAEGKVWMSWDDQHLYIAADITDQVVRNSWDKPNEVWMGDALWVGLKWREGQGGPYDVIYGLSPGDFGKVPPVAALFNRFGASNEGASAGQYAVARTPEGYALELAIPLSELAPQGEEKGTPFVPRDGMKLTADFVIYDSDAKEGSTSKEKMVCWSCLTDRYDSTEGGTVWLGDMQSQAIKTISAPRAQGITVDGKLDDWPKQAGQTAQIGQASAVMTDASASGPNLDDLLYERPADNGAFDYTGSKFSNNGVLSSGCSLFPSTGFALLRDGDYAGKLPSTEGTAVNLTYGPYGGGHGHPDKLSIVVWHDGKQLIPDFGSCGYDSAEKGQWTAHTISHNTITVDGKSQWPGLDTDKTWPCDTFEKKAWGKLGFFYADPLVKVAQASCDNVFEGVKLTRTVALVEGQVLDFYRIQSDQKHVYDYALHIDAPFREASVPLSPLSDPLADKCGYQHIHKAQGSELTTQDIATKWGDDQAGLDITCMAESPTQVIVGDSITTALGKLMPMLVLRREAKDTIFAVVLQTSPAADTWRMNQEQGGYIAGDGGPSVVAFSPDPSQPYDARVAKFTGVMAGMTTQGNLPGISLVHGTMLEVGTLKVTADRPVSFFVGTVADRPSTVRMGPDGGKLTITDEGRKPVSVTLKGGEVYELVKGGR